MLTVWCEVRQSYTLVCTPFFILSLIYYFLGNHTKQSPFFLPPFSRFTCPIHTPLLLHLKKKSTHTRPHKTYPILSTHFLPFSGDQIMRTKNASPLFSSSLPLVLNCSRPTYIYPRLFALVHILAPMVCALLTCTGSPLIGPIMFTSGSHWWNTAPLFKHASGYH